MLHAGYVDADGVIHEEPDLDNSGEGHFYWSTTADANGNLFDVTWTVCEDDCAGALLELTATGLTSGLTAQTRFTDGTPQIESVSPTPFSPNQASSAGVKDTTTIVARNQGGGAISDFRIRIRAGTTTGTLVKEFLFGNVGGNSNVSTNWDGRDSLNTFVADGTYIALASSGTTETTSPASRIGTIVVDNTNPTVSLSSPADNAFVSGTIALSASPLDAGGNDSNIEKVEFYVDGILKGTDTSSSGGWTFSLNTTTLSNGDHSWSAKAFDFAGNNAFSSTRTIKVDNAAPTATVNPISDGCVGSPMTITGTASDLPAQPGYGVASVQVTIRRTSNNAVLASGAAVNTGVNFSTWSFTYTPSEASAQNATAVATDQAGNTGSSAAQAFTVNAKPTVTINASPATSVCEGTQISLTANASPSGGTVSYSWTKNGSPFGGDMATVTDTPAVGTHTYAVTVSRNGCVSDPSQVTITVNAKPACSITGPDTVCAGASGLSYLGPAGMSSYSWSISGNGSTSGAVNKRDVTVNAGGAGTFTLILNITDANGCSSSCTNIVTVNATSVGGTATASPSTVCSGSSSTITLTGHTGSIQWQSSPDNVTFTDISGATAATLNTGPLTAATYFRAKVTSGVCPPAFSSVATVMVNPSPTASAGANKSICSGSSTTIGGSPTASGGTAPYTFSWSPTTGLSSATAANPTASPTTTTTYTVTVTDANGCTATSSMTVTVNPLPSCSISGLTSVCPQTSGLTYTGPAGSGLSYNWSISGNGSISGPKNQQSANVNAGSVGSFTLSLTVTDANGCSSTCQQLVNVVDSQPPAISCPADITVPNDPGVCEAKVTVGQATATDDCVANVSGARSDGKPLTAPYPTGTTIITWTATDNAGNSSSCQQTITVNDTEAPLISGCPADVTVYTDAGRPSCDQTATWTAPTASDNCAVTSFTSTHNPGDTLPVGETTVTYTARDAAGNEKTCSFKVTVIDNTLPTITCPPDATLECTGPNTDTTPAVTGLATATDNCGIDKTQNSDAVTPACGNTGTIQRTWTTTDVYGNVNSCVQTITVQDTTPPVLSDMPADTTVECDSVPAAAVITASDNCDTDVPVGYSEERIDGACPDSYTLKRTWTATDDCGNTTTYTQTITVQDTTPPVLTIPADETVECDAVPAVGSASATDNCDGSVAVSYDGEVRTDGPCADTYTLTRTWTATDNCGNSTTKSQIIHVQDTTHPVLSGVPADETVECDSVPAAASPSASDNCDPAPAISFSEVRTDGNCPNNYALTRTWTATDRCGNSSSKTQVITVRDTTPPAVTAGSIASCYPTVADAEAAAIAATTATDNCTASGSLTKTASTVGACSATITVTVTDECGNSDSVTYHTRIDNTPPVITFCPPPKTVSGDRAQCTAALNPGLATATDNCDPSPTVTGVRSDGQSLSAAYPNGITTITWTATDSCGNKSSCTQTITVLPRLRVAFRPPLEDDNVDNNIETDADASNRFQVNSTIPHKVKLYDCNGVDVTASVAPSVTVKLNVTLRDSGSATYAVDLPESFTGMGGPGGIMILTDGQFHYNLKTTGYPTGTVATTRYFRSHVTVTYNSNPTIIVGEEDATLESR